MFAVNGWQTSFHLATGLLGLVAVGYAARAYALGLGLLYVVVAIWGFIVGSGESILGVVPVNGADNVLHLLLGVAGWRRAWPPRPSRRPKPRPPKE